MTTDRWQRIDTLYHEMLARPLDERAAALSAACSGDIELQADVQSLLDQPESAAGSAPLDVAAQLLSPAASQLTGRRHGVFEVLEAFDNHSTRRNSTDRGGDDPTAERWRAENRWLG